MLFKDLVIRLISGGGIVLLLIYKERSIQPHAVSMSIPLIGFYCIASAGLVWYYLKNKKT